MYSLIVTRGQDCGVNCSYSCAVSSFTCPLSVIWEEYGLKIGCDVKSLCLIFGS